MKDIAVENVQFIDDFKHISCNLKSYKNILLVCGSGPESKYGAQLYSNLKNQLSNVNINSIDIPGDESAKTMQIVSILWDMFAKFGLDRQSLVISLGGGSLSDCVGFAACTYKRGVFFSSVPTTLLSMVDACIGGKRAINTDMGKNQIGCFYSAKDVFINIDILDSLDEDEKLSGLCEILKCGFLEGANFYKYLQNFNSAKDVFCKDCLNELIDMSIKFKQDIVANDYFDRLGIREILNYGHSLGHALEARFFEKKASHGLCVAIGMDFAARVFSSDAVIQAQTNLFVKMGIGKYIDNLKSNLDKQDVDLLIDLIRNDKKQYNSEISFVYLEEVGKPSIKKIRLNQLRPSLLKYIEKRI